MRRVTFSRNYTLSLSRTCQCYCKYCAFATHQAHIRSPEEVEGLLDEALKRNAKELLVLTGERPEVNPVVAARLAEWGHEDFTSYVVWSCERALERGMLPHTNIGVLDHDDLSRLREVTASQGLMLESVSERLMETVHAGSPTKHPARRLATIQAAGELKIPFTSGILVGIGETQEEQVESLEALAELHEKLRALSGGDPAKLRAAPEVLRGGSCGHRRRGFAREVGGPGTPRASGALVGALPAPWASPVGVDDIKRLISECSG